MKSDTLPYEFTMTFRRASDVRVVISDADYQRNGISGVGFWQFTLMHGDRPEQPLIAVLFTDDDDCYCAVINPADMADHWRGDVFKPYLKEWVEASRDTFFQWGTVSA